MGRTAAALVALLLLAALLRPAPAGAHAYLVRTDPADPCSDLSASRPRRGDPHCVSGLILATPPPIVRLWFSEKVEPFGGGLNVTGPDGLRVERSVVRVQGSQLSVDVDASTAGTYLVRWAVIAGDTHPARGSFAFSVLHPSVSLTTAPAGRDSAGGVATLGLVLQVSARFLHFAGYALGFGTLAFLVLVLRPVVVAVGIPGGRRLRQLTNAGVLLLLCAEILGLIAQTGSVTPGQIVDPDLLGAALASSFGRVLAQRLAAALLLWVLAGILQQGEPRAAYSALAVGALLALVDGEASHAGRFDPAWLGFLLNGVHVAAMGLWLGGLLALLALWRFADTALRRALVRRFGRVAAAAFLLLIATGAIMAVGQLAGPLSLPDSGYGRTLAAKLGAVSLAVLLAGSALHSSTTHHPRLWRGELGVLLGVTALAGLLVSLPPPR